MSIRLLTTPEASVPGMSQCSQPLRVRDHRHRVAGAADRKAFGDQLVDQRLNLVEGAQHELDVAAGGEAHMALGELIADVAELADGEHVHLALRAGAHGPHLVAALGDMMQDAGPRPVMPRPCAVVLLQERMHVRKRIGNSRLRWDVAFAAQRSFAVSPRKLSCSSLAAGFGVRRPAHFLLRPIRPPAPCARNTSPPRR